MPEPLVTPKQVAQAIGVSESSLKRWCDQGRIPTVRTAGGHRRLAVPHVVQFLRASGHPLERPELLGLPSNTGRSVAILERARPDLRDALIAGDEDRVRRIVLDLHLAGHSAAEICDQVVAPPLHEIGELWKCGEVEVYRERRACELCTRVLLELRSFMPEPPRGAPRALGGAPECDPYTLPTLMVEIVLRQAGWSAQSLGARLPFSTLAAAANEAKPRLFWLSVSQIDDESRFVEEHRGFYRRTPPEVAVVVGGRALAESVRRRIEYAAFCDKLQHLESFAKALTRSSKSAADQGEAS